MKLEIDHFYRTRDGRKAWVSYAGVFNWYAGCIYGLRGEWCWHEDGLLTGEYEPHNCDLVAEWGSNGWVQHQETHVIK